MENYKFIKLLALALCLNLSVNLVYAQDSVDTKRFFVYFKDKKSSKYSLKKPEDFLTKRALERRKRQGIKLTTLDLPVSDKYLREVKKLGAKVWYSSRWMNGAVIACNDGILEKVKALKFVKSESELLIKSPAKEGKVEEPVMKINTNAKFTKLSIDGEEDYGKGYNQAKMLDADEMHRLGYRGKDVFIAVLDAGFQNVDKIPAFKHLFVQGRILGTYNFVNNNDYVYGVGSHGTMVLSTIAAYQKGEMIGTAPEASFYLFRTEDASTENRIEEANWLIAAEKADSLGVDVINSSLGYTDFDVKSMNYTYKSLDGNTAFITKAADLAARTGMLIVTSAGNEGGGSWKYVGTPADADSVLAVGATYKDGTRTYFSSVGPTSDGRIKPDVSAQGGMSTVVRTSGRVGIANGTSFSSPITCGLVAGFWQANPNLTNYEIIEFLRKSGTQAEKPDTLLGYGIPSFIRANDLVQKTKKGKTKKGFYIKSKPESPKDKPKKYEPKKSKTILENNKS